MLLTETPVWFSVGEIEETVGAVGSHVLDVLSVGVLDVLDVLSVGVLDVLSVLLPSQEMTMKLKRR